MRRRSIPFWLIAGLCAYLAALMFYRLDAFPALHGDEVWAGQYANRIVSLGIYSPHEMNTYTGPLYGWLISKWFSALSVSVFSLRLTGAILNLLAAFLLALHFARRLGRESALAWMYLLATSAMFFYTGRIAWEVCALQNLLLAALVVVCRVFIEERRYPYWAVAVFLAANYIGVWNHFIFLSVPLSLCALSSCDLALYRAWGRLKFFQLTVCNLAMALLVCLLKPPMTEEFWRAYKALLIPLGLAAPFLFAALFEPAARRTEAAAKALLEKLSGRKEQVFYRRLFALGMLAFFIFHAAPIVQIWSNVLIFKRLASWAPPLFLSAVLHVWAAALLGACLVFAWRHIPSRRMAELGPYERFLVFWPAAYAAVFILVRHTSSIRYYIIPSFLFMVCAAVVLPRLPAFRRRGVAAFGFIVAAFLNVCYWSEIRAPEVRPPMRFRVGWRLEKSADFMSKEPVLDAMRREGVCVLDQKESMIDLPLMFAAPVSEDACDRTKRIAVRYCWECERPPYFIWKIRTTP